MKRSLLPLVALILAIPVMGQIHLVHRQATGIQFYTTTPTPPNNGLAWWWVASDVPTNSVVTNWVDRIRGAVLSNTFGSTCPTNTATNGIYFNGASNQILTTSITVAGTGISTNFSMFAVLKRPVGNTFQALVSKDNSGSFVWQFRANVSPAIWSLYEAGFEYVPFNDIFNTWFDMAFTSSDAPLVVGYTNGVSYASTNASLFTGTTLTLGQVGYTTSEPFTGWLRELLIYTNASSAPSVAQMHTYATNLYGYTP